MRVAKAEAGRFQDRFKDGRQKTEDAFAEAGKAVSEVFTQISWRKPAWFGGDEPRRKNSGGLDRAPLPPSLVAPATDAVSTTTPPVSRVVAQAPLPPAPRVPVPGAAPKVAPTPPAPPAPPANEDDAAMRYHFAALERLVAMGLSPQAARTAMRHMDEWLVSKAGVVEIEKVEARAREAGEHILHKGDHVRLQGLVKNAAANGNMAYLQTYVAESQRWKVALHDGKSYLLQPKFLQPMQSNPSPLEANCSEALTNTESSPSHEDSSSQAEAAALDSVREELARTQRLWKEAQEAKEIELLEREECLRRQQDELEAQQRLIAERRHSIAIAQARSLAALEQQAVAASPEQGRESRREFVMDDDLQPAVYESGDQAVDGTSDIEEEDDGEEDEVWDMDWSALGSEGRSSPKSPQTTAAELGHPPAVAPAAALQFHRIHSEPIANTEDAPAVASQVHSEPIANTEDALAVASQVHSERTSNTEDRALASNQVGPTVSSDDREKILRKLEEKRQLAERHNGEDLTAERSINVTKEKMPGAHPALAAKLEQRRLMHEAQEQRMAQQDDAI